MGFVLPPTSDDLLHSRMVPPRPRLALLPASRARLRARGPRRHPRLDRLSIRLAPLLTWRAFYSPDSSVCKLTTSSLDLTRSSTTSNRPSSALGRFSSNPTHPSTPVYSTCPSVGCGYFAPQHRPRPIPLDPASLPHPASLPPFRMTSPSPVSSPRPRGQLADTNVASRCRAAA